MYTLLILLTDVGTGGLGAYADAIRAEYASHTGGSVPALKVAAEKMTVSFGAFRFTVHYVCGEHVKKESAEIVSRFGRGHPQAKIIAGAACRYEVSSMADANMDYFNDMLFLSHAAYSVPGAYVFDVAGEEFHEPP